MRSRAPALPPLPPPLPPGRVVSLPGRGEVFVRDSGARSGGAPAVLLLHGWTASADVNFFPAYSHLARSYRVIAPDQRGHGRGMRSDEPFRLEDCADDAAALLERLGTGPVIALGYSMGGPVALQLARRHPGLVTSLVMQATALEFHRDVRDQVVWRLLPVLGLGMRLGADGGFVEWNLRRMIEQAPGIDACRPWLAAEFRRTTARDLAAAGRALSRFDARPWAGRLGLRTVALITTRDRVVRPVRQREMARVLGAEVLEIAADHDLPMTHGEEYARLTRHAVDIVAGTAGGQPDGEGIPSHLVSWLRDRARSSGRPGHA